MEVLSVGRGQKDFLVGLRATAVSCRLIFQRHRFLVVTEQERKRSRVKGAGLYARSSERSEDA